MVRATNTPLKCATWSKRSTNSVPKSPCSRRIANLTAAVLQSANNPKRKRACIKNVIPMKKKILLTRDYWNQQNFLVPERNAHPFGLSPNQFNPQTGTNVQTTIPGQTEYNTQNGFNPQTGANAQNGTGAQPPQAGQSATNTQQGLNTQ